MSMTRGLNILFARRTLAELMISRLGCGRACYTGARGLAPLVVGPKDRAVLLSLNVSTTFAEPLVRLDALGKAEPPCRRWGQRAPPQGTAPHCLCLQPCSGERDASVRRCGSRDVAIPIRIIFWVRELRRVAG